MGIYNRKVNSYAYLPLWRCTLCNLEMECVSPKNPTVVLALTTARSRFINKHGREKPNCSGKYAYVPGVHKQPEER